MCSDNIKIAPTFIGAGATKSGSSWLYANLSNHPDIYAPVKEVSYFNDNLEKGLEWYQSLFESGQQFSHSGEVTPTYLYNPDIPKIIVEQLPNTKVIFILRNPVHRSYSQYKSNYYTGQTKSKNFQLYLEENPSSLQRGYYFQHLKPWFEHIPASNIKIFIFEEATSNLEYFKKDLADFLDIDVAGFHTDKLGEKANASNAPKLRLLYQAGFYVSQLARRYRLFKMSKIINRTGSKFFALIGDSTKTAPPLDEHYYEQLISRYQTDIAQLSELMGRHTPIWK